MPKAVVGSIAIVVAYAILFFVTKDNKGVLLLPAETLYLLLAYAFIGCLGLVFVLPYILIREERRKDDALQTPNASAPGGKR
ncbi:hypothetical protein [Brevibacillus sp. H7]|uniref:hypothetical protein n=1 Tax=Brevibacillus sp. H7 TaxID=3349138 RepID=UPI00381AAF51